MTKFIAPFFFLILFACTPNEEESSSLNSFQGVFSSEPPLEADVVFYKDIPYGSGDREKMDLLLPNNKALEGLVVFFHGGSFQFGSKEDLYREELQPILKATLENNIAFASVGYTFITDAQSEGVFTTLENGSDAIDFLRKNSAVLNIPSNKIILAGVSAGAGIALWNGFSEQTNAEVEGILALYAQSSYDLYQWNSLFEDFDLDSIRNQNSDIETLFTQFYGGEYTSEKGLRLDFSNQMDGDDPPLYLYNPTYEEDVFSGETLNLDVLFHSYKHADFLRAKAIEVGLPISGAYVNFPQDFIRNTLMD